MAVRLLQKILLRTEKKFPDMNTKFGHIELIRVTGGYNNSSEECHSLIKSGCPWSVRRVKILKNPRPRRGEPQRSFIILTNL